MLSKEQLQIVENEARLVLQKLGVEPADIRIVQTDIEESGEPTVEVAIQAPEPKIIIGERGQTLFEFQHILKLILRKKIAEPFYLSLDVNEYKKNKEEYLRDLAKTCADEVVLLKKPKELSPMPAAERRIVHMALAERTDVVSESIGEGADRRVVIRLKG
jgi:spoIIIJ-associated protein